ncbi:hypothetical protein Bbelb_305590 [Branchiostoma belcheri]|nr:hypothetical protein Bbelb_305590 [Branchiostoma belcheri]
MQTVNSKLMRVESSTQSVGDSGVDPPAATAAQRGTRSVACQDSNPGPIGSESSATPHDPTCHPVRATRVPCTCQYVPCVSSTCECGLHTEAAADMEEKVNEVEEDAALGLLEEELEELEWWRGCIVQETNNELEVYFIGPRTP